MMLKDTSSVADPQQIVFDSTYNLIEKEGWITNNKNKAKVKSFRLEHKRSCVLHDIQTARSSLL